MRTVRKKCAVSPTVCTVYLGVGVCFLFIYPPLLSQSQTVVESRLWNCQSMCHLEIWFHLSLTFLQSLHFLRSGATQIIQQHRLLSFAYVFSHTLQETGKDRGTGLFLSHKFTSLTLELGRRFWTKDCSDYSKVSQGPHNLKLILNMKMYLYWIIQIP